MLSVLMRDCDLCVCADQHGMPRHGMAWYNMAWHGMGRHGITWHGMANHSRARHNMASHGMAQHESCLARGGGTAQHGTACPLARTAMARSGTARQWHSTALARHGTWHAGTARVDRARHGMAQSMPDIYIYIYIYIPPHTYRGGRSENVQTPTPLTTHVST